MKNLGDLHNLLFDQLERLSDKNLNGDELKVEISRAESISGIADRMIANGSLVLKAAIAVPNSIAEVAMPQLLESPKTAKKIRSEFGVR